ncbi:MAG: OmpA family protein [Candidatus Cryptobacteroides sp.]
MKRIFSVIASLVLVASIASAQKDDFKGYWFLQLQGGAAHTVGETDFSDLISPSAALSVGYQFTPVIGLRLNANGWQGKGAIANGRGAAELFKYNYVEGGLDVMADLASLFAGYKFDRTLNPYIFGGIGANYAFNNDEANALKDYFPSKSADNYLWDGGKLLGALRAGIGLNIRLADCVALNLEGNTSFIGDHFNSKKGSAADFQIKALAGLTFSFGKAKPAPAPVIIPPAPAPQPEPEPVVEEKVVEEPAFESLTRNVLFIINTWDIRECEQYKIDEVVEALKANPDTKVRVSGYADKETGTAKRNLFLSQKRSEVVAAAIVAAGIDEDRIITEYFGDTVNPFDTPEENRVAVCLVK